MTEGRRELWTQAGPMLLLAPLLLAGHWGLFVWSRDAFSVLRLAVLELGRSGSQVSSFGRFVGGDWPVAVLFAGSFTLFVGIFVVYRLTGHWRSDPEKVARTFMGGLALVLFVVLILSVMLWLDDLRYLPQRGAKGEDVFEMVMASGIAVHALCLLTILLSPLFSRMHQAWLLLVLPILAATLIATSSTAAIAVQLWGRDLPPLMPHGRWFLIKSVTTVAGAVLLSMLFRRATNERISPHVAALCLSPWSMALLAQTSRGFMAPFRRLSPQVATESTRGPAAFWLTVAFGIIGLGIILGGLITIYRPIRRRLMREDARKDTEE